MQGHTKIILRFTLYETCEPGRRWFRRIYYLLVCSGNPLLGRISLGVSVFAVLHFSGVSLLLQTGEYGHEIVGFIRLHFNTIILDTL